VTLPTDPNSPENTPDSHLANGESEAAAQPPVAFSEHQLVLEQLNAAKELAGGTREQLLRTAADFENFRKRARREAEDASASGREAMLKDLLPVFDNLERATSHVDTTNDTQSLVSGIQMVLRQFQDILKRVGIERIQSVGQVFDPNLHEAIQQVVTAEFEPGRVASEVQAGYRLGERLVRPAMVVVAKAPDA
jgi:molecular chaperone GrpE